MIIRLSDRPIESVYIYIYGPIHNRTFGQIYAVSPKDKNKNKIKEIDNETQ